EGDEVVLSGDGVLRRFGIALAPGSVTVFDGAEAHVFALSDPLAASDDSHHGGDEIRAPMPGLVRQIGAKADAAVAKGDVLVVLEAMKMEHALTAPRDGQVAVVHVKEGAQVIEGMLLLALE